jgi:hypothetical protein
MAYRLALGVFAAGVLALSAVAGARAGCPNIGFSYQVQLGTSVTNGVRAADGACAEGDPTKGTCNSFVGRVLDKTYGYPDFRLGDRYMNVAELNAFLPSSTTWTMMGYAGEQLVLDQALLDANNGAPVIALSRDQVVLVLPGRELQHSPTWNLCVPLSAGHVLGEHSQNYTSDLLSTPWDTPHGVVIWERTGPLAPQVHSLPAAEPTRPPSPSARRESAAPAPSRPVSLQR